MGELVRRLFWSKRRILSHLIFLLVWESEEWLKKNAKPVGPAGVGSHNSGNTERNDPGEDEAAEAMEE